MKSFVLGACLSLVTTGPLRAQTSSIAEPPDALAVRGLDSTSALSALCRQSVTSLEAGAALAHSILANVAGPAESRLADHVDVRRAKERLGGAVALFTLDGDRGVILVADSTDGAVLAHEATHATTLHASPDSAARIMQRVLALDSAGRIDKDIAALARRSFILGFASHADPSLWAMVPFVLQTWMAGDSLSHDGLFARLIRASDSVAVRLKSQVAKGWRQGTIADAYDEAANAHWRYAGVPRPRNWTWREERTFRLAGEVVAYERQLSCAPSRGSVAN
jgi:hypothetical protein